MNKLKFKNLLFLIAITLIVLQSCEKKELIGLEDTTLQKDKKVYVNNGIPVFQSQEAYSDIINELANKSEIERKQWEESLGFKSLHTIYNELNEVEIALEEKLYSGYDENLSKKELQKLGLPIDVHSDIYKEYLNKGIIKEVRDDDGSEAFYLNVFDPIAACYTNENGLMVINDTLYQYTASKLKMMPGNTLKADILLNAKNTDKTNNIFVINFDDKSTISGDNWSKSSGWKYESSKKRYRMDVKGWSWTYGPNDDDYMGSKFWVDLKAERKRWGKWKRRNSYKPVKQLHAVWDYKYTISKYWYGGYPRHTYYNNLNGGGKSPVNVNYGHVNYGTYQYLNPTGNWSSSWYFVNPVYMNSYTITGYFDPGTIILTR